MLFFRKRRNRYTLDELALRREKRAEVVRSSLPLFAIVLMMCMVALLSLLCLKPWKELRELEQERNLVADKLKKAQEDLERSKNEYMWMIKDPEYFEIIARDKNNLALPGENIVRIVEPEQPLR